MGGYIAAHSMFALLQSAGAGGYGLAAVNAVAASAAMAGTCGTVAVSFLEAMRKDDCECSSEGSLGGTNTVKGSSPIRTNGMKSEFRPIGPDISDSLAP